jgi:hypothetical protein
MKINTSIKDLGKEVNQWKLGGLTLLLILLIGNNKDIQEIHIIVKTGLILLGRTLKRHILIHHLQMEDRRKIGRGMESKMLRGGKKEAIGRTVKMFLLMLLVKSKNKWEKK